MLTKMVNGKECICTPEEEAEIRAEWEANDKKAIEDQKIQDRKNELVLKYGDLYETIDKIVTQLGVKI